MWGKFQDEIRGKFHQTDLLLACGVIGLVLLLVIPLPPFLLDLLLCLNIVFSVMALLLTLYVEQALEFSSFPAALLFLTLYRLGLNIASTRMILTRGEGGDIIATFGNFVTQGHIGVGLIIFALLTTINFVVVTKGAGRVAEVAARFTLEALPGKQMTIDGELSSGLISQEEAKAQHTKVEQEAEFYGAMDGASKFVRGDAVAGIIITLVNIFGGLIVGFFVRGMSPGQCWHLFTRLTVGDGLVSQIPALLISIAAGIMVTRCSSQSLGAALGRQFFCQPKVLIITALLLVLLGLIPGMPFFVMAPIATLLFIYAWAQLKAEDDRPLMAAKKGRAIELELGPLLAGRVDEVKEEISKQLKAVERGLGIKLPQCQIRDNVALSPSAFEIKIGGVTATRARSELTELSTKIAAAVSTHCHELICRQDVARMVDSARKVDAAVVNELIGKKLSIGELLAIVQELLREKIPVTNFTLILESLADTYARYEVVDQDLLIQKVRERLSRVITEQFVGEKGVARVIRLDPHVEKMIEVSVSGGATTTKDRLRPQIIEKVVAQLLAFQKAAGGEGVLLTEASVRSKLKRLIESKLPDLPVLAYSELGREVEFETIGTITKEVLLA